MTGPAAPRDAATVILLRDAPGGPQTWLLTRRTTLAFAAGMSVYPGGRVDAADVDVPLARPQRADEVAAGYGIDLARAHALVAAAARETFEETGVLLTVPAAPPDLVAARTAVEARELDFAALLATHGLAVDGDAFVPWARWITPEAEPRRYDTFFFLAVVPPGVEAADVTTESTSATWVDVAATMSGATVLMPPTRVTLAAVAQHATVADVVAAAARAELGAIAPVLHVEDAATYVVLPDGTRIDVRRP